MAVRDHDRGGWIPVLNKHKKQVGDTGDPLVTLFVDNFPEDVGTRWAMWQDNKTRSKWVFVNRCYFANDLPEADGRPCSPESNEVYESNHDNTIVAGLIRGPCVVLPPSKFNEESGRRSGLGPGANDGLQPLYLCKWFFDESKGVFRDVLS